MKPRYNDLELFGLGQRQPLFWRFLCVARTDRGGWKYDAYPLGYLRAFPSERHILAASLVTRCCEDLGRPR